MPMPSGYDYSPLTLKVYSVEPTEAHPGAVLEFISNLPTDPLFRRVFADPKNILTINNTDRGFIVSESFKSKSEYRIDDVFLGNPQDVHSFSVTIPEDIEAGQYCTIERLEFLVMFRNSRTQIIHVECEEAQFNIKKIKKSKKVEIKNLSPKQMDIKKIRDKSSTLRLTGTGLDNIVRIYPKAFPSMTFSNISHSYNSLVARVATAPDDIQIGVPLRFVYQDKKGNSKDFPSSMGVTVFGYEEGELEPQVEAELLSAEPSSIMPTEEITLKTTGIPQNQREFYNPDNFIATNVEGCIISTYNEETQVFYSKDVAANLFETVDTFLEDLTLLIPADAPPGDYEIGINIVSTFRNGKNQIFRVQKEDAFKVEDSSEDPDAVLAESIIPRSFAIGREEQSRFIISGRNLDKVRRLKILGYNPTMAIIRVPGEESLSFGLRQPTGEITEGQDFRLKYITEDGTEKFFPPKIQIRASST